MRVIRVLSVLCLASLFLAGCGGGGSGVATTAPTTNSAGSATPSDGLAAGLPAYSGELDRVCETRTGFAGTAAYDAKPGLHPVALFYDHGEPASLIEASVTLPAGWAITQDADYASSSEFAALELVACSRRTKAVPNSVMCDFTPSGGGATTTLELTDTVYELTVYAAATGQRVGSVKTLAASATECPMIASFTEGDKHFLNTPTDEQYVEALKEFVTP